MDENTILIKDLEPTTNVNDEDILIIESDHTTYQIKASDLTTYIGNVLKDLFVQLTEKGETDGVVPLNAQKLIDSKYIPFGKNKGSVYEGSEGLALETKVDEHINNSETKGTYKSVTVNNKGHVVSGTNPTTLEEYGITDAAKKEHTHKSADIISLDASKITGVLDIARIPKGALERIYPVASDAERFKLTKEDVQNGDTVQVNNKQMYVVIDETKLNTEAGYREYTAGAATSVPWTGVSNKPSTYPPSVHKHEDLEQDIKNLNNSVDSIQPMTSEEIETIFTEVFG